MKPITRIALLSSGPPLSLKVLYCLRLLGVSIDLIDLGRTSIAKYSRYKARYFNASAASSGTSVQETETAIIHYISRSGISGVVPGDVAAAGFLHSIRTRLSDIIVFPVSSKETLNILDNKWLFSELLRMNQIVAPVASLLKSYSDLDKVEDGQYAFPLVVKSLLGESGHGVVYIRKLDELRKYLNSDHPHAKFPLIIQEYAHGIDADISILAQDGVVYAHVLQLRRLPDILEFAHNEKALDLVTRIVKAANFSGVANIDLRIDEKSGEIKVIECNPRFWYTLQASLWRGLNFVAAGLDLAQGRNIMTVPPDNGRYYYHGYIAKKILFRPREWRNVPGYNWHGFLQAVTDPVPFLFAESRRLIAFSRSKVNWYC